MLHSVTCLNDMKHFKFMLKCHKVKKVIMEIIILASE